MQRMNFSRRRAGAGLIGLALVVSACGGGDDDTSETADDTTESTSEATSAETTEAPGTDPVDDTESATTTDAPADEPADATYEPGPYQYRVVNLLAEPVDVYGRTQGLVQAFELELGVAPMAVTAFVAPPVDGTLIITTPGGDSECVATCPHIIANLSSFESDGPHHTVVLHDADGAPAAFDLWENHDGTSTSGNAMEAASADAGLFEVTSIDVSDNDFGMRLGFAGTTGCVEGDQPNILVGGNQVPAWTYGGDSVDVLFYDNQDQECAEPVGGPFTVEGGPGARTHLILTGAPGALEALIVPFASVAGAVEPTTGGDEGAGDASGDAELAVAAIAGEIAVLTGMPEADAQCLAQEIIDAIGLDAAVQGGELLDLDSADEAIQEAAFDAFVAGMETCGVDPEALGDE